MAEPQQLSQITFAGGINEAVRDEAVDPEAEFLVRQNTRQPQRGVADKRYGFAARSRTRSDATSRSAGYKLLSYNGTACVIDGHQLDAWSTTGSVDVPRARVPECVAIRRPLASRSTSTGSFLLTVTGAPSGTKLDGLSQSKAVAYANGYYILMCGEQTTSSTLAINAYVVDKTTGEVMSSAQLPSSSGLTAIDQVKMVVAGTDVVAVWADATAGNIYASRLSVASVSAINTGWAARVTLTTTYGDGFVWDACGLTTRFVLAYANTAGTTGRITVTSFDSTVNALTQLQTDTVTTDNSTVDGIAVDGLESDILFVARSQDGFAGAYVEGRNPTTLTSVTATAGHVITAGASAQIRLAIGRTATGAGYIACMHPSTGWVTTEFRKFTVSGGTVGASGSTATVYGWTPCSKPFAIGSRVYMEFSHDDVTSTAQCLFDITTPTASSTMRPVAWTAPRLHLGTPPSGLGPAHNVAVVSSTKVATVAIVQSSAVSSSLTVVEYDFASTTRWQPAIAAGCLLISAGVPQVFDGQQVSELSFLVPPRLVVAASGTGITGNFNYTAIYEYTDAAGNVVWSEPGTVQNTGDISNKTVTVTVRTLSATWRDGSDTAPLEPQNIHRVRIKIYRTQTGGGVFYLLTTLINDLSAGTVTYADSTADTSLIAGAQPYRSPGVSGAAQPRQNIGSVRGWCEYNGMIVAIGDDGLSHFYTPQHVQGEQVYFSDVFQFPIEQDGPSTAIFSQDGTCFITKRRAIYAGSGEPASDNGSSGGLGAFRKLAVDVGCIEARSIVTTTAGTFFQSDRGIELLDRSQTVQWIGEKVRKTLASYPIITAATLDAKNSLVYFECVATETANVVGTNGVTLVYDLARQQWESVDYRTSGAGTANCAAQSAAYIDTGSGWAYAWLSSDGYVHVEDSTTHLDPGPTYVPKHIETAWWKAGGFQGMQQIDQVMLLAKAGTDNDLTISQGYDYASSYAASPTTFTAATLNTIAGELPNLQVALDPNDDARCQAFRVKLVDATGSSGSIGTGQGSPWLGLTVVTTPVPGAYQLPDVCR